MSKYAKMGERMFHNIRDFLNLLGRIVLQFLRVTLAVGGGKRGGKLSRSGLGRPDF
jgi:hypothetical protein